MAVCLCFIGNASAQWVVSFELLRKRELHAMKPYTAIIVTAARNIRGTVMARGDS